MGKVNRDLGLYTIREDSKLHPLTHASRSLSFSEKSYTITELATLAVVWAISHFRYHLYGHRVTDHTTVKAVFGSPNLNGEHTRWWNKVHGSGIREVDIMYQSKQNNIHADALSRQPVLSSPLEDDELSLVEEKVTMTTPLLIFYHDLLLLLTFC